MGVPFHLPTSPREFQKLKGRSVTDPAGVTDAGGLRFQKRQQVPALQISNSAILTAWAN